MIARQSGGTIPSWCERYPGEVQPGSRPEKEACEAIVGLWPLWRRPRPKQDICVETLEARLVHARKIPCRANI